jgi:hypothetical protein
MRPLPLFAELLIVPDSRKAIVPVPLTITCEFGP